MREYEPLQVDTPLNDREQKSIDALRKTTRLMTKTPQCLFEMVIRAGLKRSRENSRNTKGIEAHTKHAVEKQTVSLDGGAGLFQLYIYKREKLPPGRHPLFYFIHGGGFIDGSALRNENLLMRLADEHAMICASVEYHLAPELRFPGAIHECAFGIKALFESDEIAQSIDRGKVIVSGDSAGGALAIGAALTLRRKWGIVPSANVLFYPVTEMYRMDTSSYKSRAPECRSMKKFIKVCRRLYARNREDYTDPLFSPLLLRPQEGEGETGKTLLLLAGRDGLLDDGVLYGKLLQRQGADVKTIIYTNAYHAFINELGDSNIAEHAYHEIHEFLRT
jgi:acetyl esterase